MNAKSLIEAVLGIAIGLAMYPSVSSFAETAAVNATGASALLIPLVPLVYLFVVIGGAVAYLNVG